MTTTTIRVSTGTRDRLNGLISSRYPGKTVDDVINTLLDDDWRIRALADADAWRRANPEQWRAELAELDRWGGTDVSIDATEGPYFASEADYRAALTQPTTEHRDAA